MAPRRNHRRGAAWLVGALAASTACADLRGRVQDSEIKIPVRPGPSSPRLWYIDLSFRVGFPRLAETQRLLHQRLDGPLSVDVLDVWAKPRTPLDQRADGELDALSLGIGWRQNDWLTWNLYVGGAAGGQQSRQRYDGLRLGVDFEYAAYFAGLTADIYPLGIPQYRDFANWRERLGASRPYVVTGFETGYVRGQAHGGIRFGPLPIYVDQARVRDWPIDYLLGLGWELPLSARWSFNLSGQYAFNFYRPQEYNGWNVAFALRFRF